MHSTPDSTVDEKGVSRDASIPAPDHPVDEMVQRAACGGFVSEKSSLEPAAPKAGNPRQATGPPLPRLGYSVAEFCKAVGISVSYFYYLLERGKAPRSMLLGSRRIISVEEALRWCRKRTAQPIPSSKTNPSSRVAAGDRTGISS